ncbi:MAG TPA: cytochrome c [Thermoanaerobaculia bacterium]|nr:cytochrome c [Thermoanaerobaculia bacterium]
MKRFLVLFACALLATSASADDASSLVKYRQSVMKSMGAHMSAMSLVVKKQVSSRAQLAAHAEAIRGVSDGLAAFFPAGTDPSRVTTAALPAIWQRSAEFSAAAQKLQREAAKLAAFAKSGDARGFDAQFERVGAACNECHKQFRKRDSD